MITTLVFALAIATTAPFDPGRAPIDAAAATSAAAVTATQPTKAKKPTIYCLKDTITGSRIIRSECRTRAEWMAQGFDPIAPK